MARRKKNNKTPVIAVLNMKGGVGKTTISANLFQNYFYNYRLSTLLIDLDPQFNLTQTLFTRTRYERIKSKNATILEAMEPSPHSSIFEIQTSDGPPPKPEEIGYTLKFHWFSPNTRLMIVPGDFSLVKYSLMDDNSLLNSVKKRFLKFVESARGEFQIICIDCNPSSSFLTLCALHACTHILVPVRPDRYSILGLEMLANFVDSVPTLTPKPEFIVLLNGIPRTKYNSNVEDELRAHDVFGPITLVNRIYQSKNLVASPEYTGFATDKKVPYKYSLINNLSSVSKELRNRLGESG